MRNKANQKNSNELQKELDDILIFAVKNEGLDEVEACIHLGASENATDGKKTVLEIAIEKEMLPLVEFLIGNKADTGNLSGNKIIRNIKEKLSGKFAEAIRNCDKKAISELIENGADMYALNTNLLYN